MPTSDFLNEARARGFINQCTDENALAVALASPIAGYAGFDLTADSLHVGHMIPIMLLRLFQKHGNKPVAVLGGGTSRIGDPSFREEARQLLTQEQIVANLAGITANLKRFLTLGPNPTDAILVNNADWLDPLSYVEVLRDIGPHFSINRMLSFDSVRSRLDRDQGLTFLEFNYSILQSYDFRELHRRHNVILQFGGSDQWGNIVSGIDLIRRTDRKTTYGLTTPLITTASGAKMGKSAAGAVWLTAAKLSPYLYWQFWRNTEDEDVSRFLRLFTDLPLAEITRLETLGGAEINHAKITLATAATTLAHGATAAEAAAETARQTFAEGQITAAGLPSITIPDLVTGLPAYALLVRAGLANSNGEARRLIRGGGARLNDKPLTDEAETITGTEDMKLSAGKKTHVLVRAKEV